MKGKCAGCRQDVAKLKPHKLQKATVKLCEKCHAGVVDLEKRAKESEGR